MRLSTVICCLLFIQTYTTGYAQTQTGDNTNTAAKNKCYWGNSFEGAAFSTATVSNPVYGSFMGTLRFSYVINAGLTYNYDANNNLGLFTGANIKNVGFIEKQGDSTVKHRSYNIGVPLGIKLGNLNRHRYFFAGVDLEVPVNYKEKGFISRGHKAKFNEWFSGRTPAFMPAVFAGVAIRKSLTLKVEYYLSNFMNPNFVVNNIHPYTGYDVHLLLFTIGADMHYGKKKHKTQEQPAKML